VPDTETASGITSALETSEYGVPTSSEAPTHAWLGAPGLRTELASGVLDMGARSYVSQLGRFLQPDPEAGGSGNAATGAGTGATAADTGSADPNTVTNTAKRSAGVPGNLLMPYAYSTDGRPTAGRMGLLEP
jgi:hypothetical protein